MEGSASRPAARRGSRGGTCIIRADRSNRPVVNARDRGYRGAWNEKNVLENVLAEVLILAYLIQP